MRKLVACLAVYSSLIGGMAQAAEDRGQLKSETRAPKVETKGVYEAPVQITPQLGLLGFQDARENYTSRLTEGINLMWNGAKAFNVPEGGKLGLETGFTYSHIGAPSSNFFGANSDIAENSGANSFIIPMNIVAGYTFSGVSTAVHLGANLLYRSIANSMWVGRNDLSKDSSTDLFPAIGLSAGFEVSKVVGITLRGDYVPTPASDMFAAILGATFPLG